MSETYPNLSNGGIATVFIGNSGFIKEYSKHPQVRFIDTKSLEGEMLETLVPANTKIIILTEGVPQLPYQWALAFHRQRQVPYVLKRSNQAIYDYLNCCFKNGSAQTATQEEAAETRQKGKLKDLIQFINWNLSNSENGRILVNKAVELGIKTTLGSVTQMVSKERKKTGHSERPKSARSQLDVSVELLDNMIKNLTDMREFIIATTEENRILKSKLDKFKKAFED